MSAPADTLLKMSASLAQDARSLEIALNAMPVGVSWATLADQKIVFMNRKFTEIFGYVVGDFPLISDWIGHYPYAEDRVLASQRWGEFFTAPNAGEFLIRSMELRIRCKGGAVKTIIHHGTILPDAGWALATFIDISERKRDETFLREAARQARENQAIYRTLLDHSSEMIIPLSIRPLQALRLSRRRPGHRLLSGRIPRARTRRNRPSRGLRRRPCRR